MRGQAERIWIAGLGALAAVLLIALAFVVTSGDDDAQSPAVTIVSLRATGFEAVLDFTVEAPDPPDISIDWGDSSQPLSLRAVGALSASYTYPPEPIERTVVVTVTTSGGTVLRASRSLILGEGGPVPESTTSTTASTTSTTTPGRPTIEVELVPSNAAFDQQGVGGGDARLDGRTVSVRARTSGLDGESVRTATLRWTIPAERFEGLTGNYQVRTRLEPTWSVNLRTGSNPGRAAYWYIDMKAETGSVDLGESSDVRSIGSGDEQLFRGSEVVGFGTTLPADQLADIVVTLELTCQAVPGSNIFQIGESSECDASELGSFTIDFARVLLAPVD